MVNNSTNINKSNNHLSPQIVEHNKKKTMIYGIRNPVPGLGTDTKMWQGSIGLWDSNLSPFDNWIFNVNTDVNKQLKTYTALLLLNMLTVNMYIQTRESVVVVIYGSWIYNYLYNQYLLPLTFWIPISLGRGVLDTTLFDEVFQWLAAGWWFSPGTPVFYHQ